MKYAITLLGCWLVTACGPVMAQTADQNTSAPVASNEGPTLQAADDSADSSNARAQTVSVSQVRIVRLSEVKGQVELDRKTDQAFEQAFINLPIVAGAALRTKQGLAEVEFEDNSSLRLTPESQIQFPHLGRSATGSTITDVNLVRGSLYVSTVGSKAFGEFTVNAGNEAIVLSPSTHLGLTSARRRLR